MDLSLAPAPQHDGLELPPAGLPIHRSREGATCDLATRHLQGVSTLLQTRADLRGVYAFADIVEESVRWSA